MISGNLDIKKCNLEELPDKFISEIPLGIAYVGYKNVEKEERTLYNEKSRNTYYSKAEFFEHSPPMIHNMTV